MKDLGYGKGYAYDHNAPDAFSGQNYFPDGMARQEFYRPAEVDLLIGDPTKAHKKLGWKPEVSFEQLVEMMVRTDLDRLKLNAAPDTKARGI